MHAHYRRGLHGVPPVEVLEMDHRVSLVRVAFAARVHA